MAVELETENITPENSPFRVRLNFSLSEKLQMLLCFIFVVPFRFIVCSIALVIAWAGSSIGLLGMDVNQPISGWRLPLRKVVGFMGKVCCMCVGFQFVNIKGKRATKEDAPVLDNRENRSSAVNEIKRRTMTDSDWNQFLIFPEGTTSNRKALFSFKPGGFLPGKPVQPVLIRYKMKHDTVSWTWDQPHNFIMVFLYTICQWDNPVELEYLDPYVPSEEEKADPVLFANNVRDVMADALKVPVCNMTYADVKELFAKQKKDNKAE